ncbi:hypothetical protein KAI54_03010 [Candidatus Gracilibacteria bacterium]|nr:hypothetical protein [Candidatus Gracilibacteria bacterium]
MNVTFAVQCGESVPHSYEVVLSSGSDCGVTYTATKKTWGSPSSALTNPFTETVSFHLNPGQNATTTFSLTASSNASNGDTLNSSLTVLKSPDIVGCNTGGDSGASVTSVVTCFFCGDGHIDPGEECEPPNTSTCDADCQIIEGPFCGDGNIDPGEECEPPNISTCDANCKIITLPFCGDGHIDPGEECEPPNTATCDADCQTIGNGSTSSTSSTGGSTSSTSSTGGSTSSGGSSSSSTGGGSTSSGGSSSSSTGGACSFNLDCDSAVLNDGCPIETLKIINGEVKIPLTVNDQGGCFNKNDVCVEVASTPIVANQSQDVRSASFSSCLPQASFDIVGDNLYIPAQNKSFYKVRVGENTTSTSSREICYFDTRIQPIRGTGTTRSEVLDSVADSEEVGDSAYSEARSLMNPRIEQILQPFHEENVCFPITCSNGDIVDLCGCDATGNGVTISDLDARNFSLQYLDRSNSSADPINGEWKFLADCAIDNVIFFDPPSGGSVTLDAPGDDFILPPYPITLVIRGADLRIADNIIYPPDSDASLGVILLKNDVCGTSFGGDAFLHPKPTNVVGAYYLEGSVRSTDSGWNLPSETGTSRDNTVWYQVFKNQILWEGTILSRNTIGGALDSNWPCFGQPKCPSKITSGFINCSWSEAVEHDLAYLREYFRCGNLTSALNSYGSSNWKISGCDSSFDEIVYDELDGVESADSANANETVVLRYDSRIQNNPPPGFDNIADIFQKELGLGFA